MNMESLVTRLRNTISSTASVTASTLNAVLPGNPLIREYEVTTEDYVSAGPNLLWSIYSAIKKSTREEASLWILEKKQLDSLPKRDRELVIDQARKGVSQMTRLRHPCILTVSHSLEESRDSLAFATEPVNASLSNYLGNTKNSTSSKPLPSDFYEIEIKYGLLSLIQGISFIHTEGKILHRNLSPESIIITKRGSWKLSGFEFSSSPSSPPGEMPLKFPIINIKSISSDYPLAALPNLDYIAPEFIPSTDTQEPSLTLSSDLFSLGLVTCMLFNQGKSILKPSVCHSLSSCLNQDRLGQVRELLNKESNFNMIPIDSRHAVKCLLHPDPSMRMDAHQFSQTAIFEDILIRTLEYLDSLFQWDNLEKSKFYKGLPEIMVRMPLRVKMNRVVPCLIRELVNPDMVPFVLPNLLCIADEMNQEQFKEHLLFQLKPVFNITNPIQIPLFLIQRMDLLVEKTKNCDPTFIKSEVVTLLCRSLDPASYTGTDGATVQLQELALQTVPKIAPLLEMSTIKTQILQKIKKLCSTTTTLSVKVNCLVCMGKITDHLDKWSVIDEVVSFVVDVRSREPAVLMACVGIIQMTLTKPKLGLTKEIMASKIIPFLVPISIENGLTVAQFNLIMNLIKEVLGKIETEHRSKLEQLNEMREQQSMAVMSYTATKSTADVSNGFAKITLNSRDEPSKNISQSASLSDVKNSSSFSSSSNLHGKISPAALNELITPLPVTGTGKVESQTVTTTFKTKDLTSSLINSNLNLIKSPIVPMQSTLNPTQGTTIMGLPMATQPVLQSSSFTSSSSLPAFNPIGSGNSTAVKATSTMAASAFDSLGSTLPVKQKVPMNAMKPINQPTMVNPMSTVPAFASTSMAPLIPAPKSSNPPSNATSQLSKSDLEEFLK